MGKSDGYLPSIRDSQRWRFIASISVSIILLAVLISLVVSLQTIFAVTASGVGGFTADIEELQGDDVSLYPTTGETASCQDTVDYTTYNDPQPDDQSFSMIQAEIGGATLPPNTKIAFQKDILLPEITGIGGIRVNLSNGGGTSEAGDLGDVTLDVSNLQGQELILEGDVLLDDRNSVSQFGDRTPYRGAQRVDTGEFILTGNQATLINTSARLHLLTFEILDIPNLNIQMEYINESEAIVANPTDECRTNDPKISPYIQDFDFGAPQGGQVDVTVEFTNPGVSGQTVTETAELRVIGNLVDTTTVTLDGDDAVTRTLTWNVPSNAGPGPYDFYVNIDGEPEETPTEYTSVEGHLTPDVFVQGVGRSGTITLGDGDDGSCPDSSGNGCTVYAFVENPSRSRDGYGEFTTCTQGQGCAGDPDSFAFLEPTESGFVSITSFDGTCNGPLDDGNDETFTMETDSGDTTTTTFSVDTQTDKGDNC